MFFVLPCVLTLAIFSCFLVHLIEQSIPHTGKLIAFTIDAVGWGVAKSMGVVNKLVQGKRKITRDSLV